MRAKPADPLENPHGSAENPGSRGPRGSSPKHDPLGSLERVRAEAQLILNRAAQRLLREQMGQEGSTPVSTKDSLSNK